MLRYKTETRPGLVALYDIRPGNGAGPFLQPRSPHGAAAAVVLSQCVLRAAKMEDSVTECATVNEQTLTEGLFLNCNDC